MSSPFHIRQTNPRSPQDALSHHTENASFDSVRTDLSENSSDVVIADQWVVLGRIGQGSFGEVFQVEDIHTFRHYAIKREPIKMRHPQIKHESIIYDALAGGPGIPQCHWHGQHEGFDCIVIDLLGPNLHELKEATQKFSIETVVDFGCQMVSILQHIHNRGLVYRDIKPDNFLFASECHLPEAEMLEMVGDDGMPHTTYVTPTCQQVFQKWGETHPKLYIVDFGLTTWWRDPSTGEPYPEVKKNIKNKTGTARYASLNVHRGKTHARRDDMESLGYLLLDLIFGVLPWTGIQARNSRAGWDRMKHIKQDTYMADLCAGLPQGLLEFNEYVRTLKFKDEPDYDLLRQFLSQSIDGGNYSTIVRSPFGGHTERKWMQEIDIDPIAPTPRPNTNVDQLGRHHYKPPSYQTNTCPPPPAQKRAPRYPQQQQHEQQQQNEHVFSMDGLSQHLPQATPQRHDARGGRAGGHDNTHPTSRVKRQSLPTHHEPPTLARHSSFQKLVQKNNKHQQRVGWNSHKHDDAPWEPKIDWEQPAVEKTPDTVNTSAGQWGQQQNNTWGSIEQEHNGSWAATVEKPWDC